MMSRPTASLPSPGNAKALITWVRNHRPHRSSARRPPRTARRRAAFCRYSRATTLHISECLLVSPAGPSEFARQHIGRNHRERGALPSRQGHAERGVPDECDAPQGPTLHPDLTDPVKVEFPRTVEFVEDARAFPSPVAIFSRRNALRNSRVAGSAPLSTANTNRNSDRSSRKVKRPSIRPGCPYIRYTFSSRGR